MTRKALKKTLQKLIRKHPKASINPSELHAETPPHGYAKALSPLQQHYLKEGMISLEDIKDGETPGWLII